MSDWKYVMWEANGAKLPIIFPHQLIHEELASAAGYAVRKYVIGANRNNWSSRVISAGFISGMIVAGVHGQSESLGIGSSEGDRAIINTMPYCHGQPDLLGIEARVIEAVKRGLR